MAVKTIKYIAPNKTHYALDQIVFETDGKNTQALLLNTNAGLVLKCTSKQFVRRASNLAMKFYKLAGERTEKPHRLIDELLTVGIDYWEK